MGILIKHLSLIISHNGCESIDDEIVQTIKDIRGAMLVYTEQLNTAKHAICRDKTIGMGVVSRYLHHNILLAKLELNETQTAITPPDSDDSNLLTSVLEVLKRHPKTPHH